LNESSRCTPTDRSCSLPTLSVLVRVLSDSPTSLLMFLMKSLYPRRSLMCTKSRNDRPPEARRLRRVDSEGESSRMSKSADTRTVASQKQSNTLHEISSARVTMARVFSCAPSSMRRRVTNPS